MRRLQVGFSPCPNDTFMFHGLVSGRVTVPGVEPVAVLLDIEELNRRAVGPAGWLPVTKVSVAAYGRARARYALLRAGAALGRGNGPLVVTRRGGPRRLAGLAGRQVAIPGELTTAALLLRAFAPADLRPRPMRFDRIVGAVARGEVDAGVIIHESRFTYADAGLAAVADLGEAWEGETGMPLPLGVIVADRSLGTAMLAGIEAGVRASVTLARQHPELSREYVAAHAQEMSADVCRRHVDLYVNRWSEWLDDEGMRSVEALLERAGDMPEKRA